MDSVIVTVKSSECSHIFDVEMPLDLSANILVEKILVLINSFDSCFTRLDIKYRIYIEHLGRVLDDDETLEEAGVWEGSTLILLMK